MDHPERADWSVFSDPAVGLQVRFPLRTATGSRVDRAFEPEPTWRLHLTAPDGAVYVELMMLADLTPAEEYARHRPYLLERFGPDAVSRSSAVTHLGRPALSYSFCWPDGERRVLDIPAGAGTWRITTDPRVPLNEEIVATVTIQP